MVLDIILITVLTLDIVLELWDLFTRRTHSATDKPTEDVNTLTESHLEELVKENTQHLEGITKSIESITNSVEEMNENWEEQVRGYLERTNKKEL